MFLQPAWVDISDVACHALETCVRLEYDRRFQMLSDTAAIRVTLTTQGDGRTLFRSSRELKCRRQRSHGKVGGGSGGAVRGEPDEEAMLVVFGESIGDTRGTLKGVLDVWWAGELLTGDLGRVVGLTGCVMRVEGIVKRP